MRKSEKGRYRRKKMRILKCNLFGFPPFFFSLFVTQILKGSTFFQQYVKAKKWVLWLETSLVGLALGQSGLVIPLTANSAPLQYTQSRVTQILSIPWIFFLNISTVSHYFYNQYKCWFTNEKCIVFFNFCESLYMISVQNDV